MQFRAIKLVRCLQIPSKPIFNEDDNGCYFVVYFVGVVLAVSTGFDFLAAADMVNPPSF